jgi:hypothetical protein
MIALERLDNDLSGWLARTLIAPGLLSPQAFEDAFVAVVAGASEDPDDAWLAFYRNTLAALAGGARPGGTNAEMAPVHERAAELVVGTEVVELGCCFGFLALRLARAGRCALRGRTRSHLGSRASIRSRRIAPSRCGDRPRVHGHRSSRRLARHRLLIQFAQRNLTATSLLLPSIPKSSPQVETSIQMGADHDVPLCSARAPR